MITPSAFVKHVACGSCGSSDARAVYTDGGEYCFSCGDFTRKSEVPWAIKEVVVENTNLSLPDDVSFNYPVKCVDWLNQYEISVAEAIQHNIKWSEKKQQLIFHFHRMDDPTRIGCIQARSFADYVTRKYINQGKVDDVLPIYYTKDGQDRTIVIVEDVISAIKVARNYNAVPLLGSHIPYHKVLAIKNSGHREVVVWLDHDKYETAMDICEKFQVIGVKSRVIYTDLDPKCYNSTTIRRHIESYK